MVQEDSTALIIFDEMHFLLISENEFFHEIKRDGRTNFMDFMISPSREVAGQIAHSEASVSLSHL